MNGKSVRMDRIASRYNAIMPFTQFSHRASIESIIAQLHVGIYLVFQVYNIFVYLERIG